MSVASLPPMSAPSPHAGTLELDGIVKRFGDTVAVAGVSLSIAPGEFVSLLGPSGCGKTTLLRTVAGFERPDEGRVRIGGRDVTDAPPQQRATSMVFQSYALFPSMTVGENVAYGLQVRKMPREEIVRRTSESLARVHLSGYEHRPVTQLSGGQQQRVALARALAVQPRVLLFDEPLSNLDVALRERTRGELKELQHALGTTSVYVTHDQQEALALSDRIAVMRAGRVIQVGAPEQLYREPETAFVARFLGGSNIVAGAELAGRLSAAPAPGNGHVLSIRPEDLTIGDDGVDARLLSRQFLGTYAECWVEAGGERLRMWVNPAQTMDAHVRIAASASRWVRGDDAAGA